MDGVLALLQRTLRSVQEMQALASLPNNQLNCYRAFSWKRHWLPSAQFCYTVTEHVFIESLAYSV